MAPNVRATSGKVGGTKCPIGRELFGSLRSGHDVKLSDRWRGCAFVKLADTATSGKVGGTKCPVRWVAPKSRPGKASCPLHDVTNAHLIGRELFGSLRSGHDVKLSDRWRGCAIRQVSRSRDIR